MNKYFKVECKITVLKNCTKINIRYAKLFIKLLDVKIIIYNLRNVMNLKKKKKLSLLKNLSLY